MQFRETTNALGGAATSTELSATPMNNLFDDVTAGEASAGMTDYRAFDVYNESGSTVTGVEIYMSSETTSSDTQLDFGIEGSPVGSTTAIGNDGTAPSGVTFAHATSASTLSLPDIPAGSYARVWVRRVVSSGAVNTSNDSGTIEVVYA